MRVRMLFSRILDALFGAPRDLLCPRCGSEAKRDDTRAMRCTRCSWVGVVSECVGRGWMPGG